MFSGSVWVARGFAGLAWLVLIVGLALTVITVRTASDFSCAGLDALTGSCSDLRVGSQVAIAVAGGLITLSWSLPFFWFGYMLRISHQTMLASSGQGTLGTPERGSSSPQQRWDTSLNEAFVQGVPSRSLALLGAAALVVSMVGGWGYDIGLSRELGRPVFVVALVTLLLALAISRRFLPVDPRQLDLALAAGGFVVAVLVGLDFLNVLTNEFESPGWGLWLAVAGAAMWAIPSVRQAWPALAPVVSGARAGLSAGVPARAYGQPAPQPLPQQHAPVAPPYPPEQTQPVPQTYPQQYVQSVPQPIPQPPAMPAIEPPPTAGTTPLALACHRCGTPASPGLRFCTNCGTAVSG